MRIARSVSPRRRKRLPSAKCRSTVSGSTFTTSMKASIALSGCSFSRKLSPLKYDRGTLRDSVSRCLMSIRAASHPRPKKTGKPSSHQNSKSIAARSPFSLDLWQRGHVGERGRLRGVCRRGALPLAEPELLPEPDDLAPLAKERREAGDHAEHG